MFRITVFITYLASWWWLLSSPSRAATWSGRGTFRTTMPSWSCWALACPARWTASSSSKTWKKSSISTPAGELRVCLFKAALAYINWTPILPPGVSVISHSKRFQKLVGMAPLDITSHLEVWWIDQPTSCYSPLGRLVG